MSLATMLRYPGGIIMAADSKEIRTNSNNERKLYLTQNNIGISVVGELWKKDQRIEVYLDRFIEDIANTESMDVRQTAEALLNYFRNLDNIFFNSVFLVAGYKAKDSICQCVKLYENRIETVMNDQYNIYFAGHNDIPMSLLNNSRIIFDAMNTKDAIKFSYFLIKLTSIHMKYQNRMTVPVGGPIDILVINDTEAHWYKKKSSSNNEYRPVANSFTPETSMMRAFLLEQSLIDDNN